MSGGAIESPCPRCGAPVPVTLTTSEPGDQLAAPRTECPSCGASLVRAIDGHADLGWRLEQEPSGGDAAA